ncbi:hypothetical protein CSB37_03175 [bacterium DOLZORAL124_38_8]|nr:MAG: hypothetical protein CSB37_03175 [bacterium DOLZORAL124_38_8]
MESILAVAQTPDVFVYEGRLFDMNNEPITTKHDVRISLWKTADVLDSDVEVNGSINTQALNFSNWQEVQTFTPDFNGAFSIYFGQKNPLTNVDYSLYKYFQVEIKAHEAPDTDFEILDPTGEINDAVDRQEIGTVFYAKEAESLNGKKTGKQAGDILVLGNEGTIEVEHMANATNSDIFTLDNDNNSLENIALNFGQSLGRSLFWNTVSNLFEFSNSLKINGDLFVTGDIITADKNVTHQLVPSYPESTFDLDGQDNEGSMYERRVLLAGKKRPVMVWTSRKPALQDADTYIEFQLPQNFRSFQSEAVKIWLKTEGSVDDSKVDIQFVKGDSVVASVSNISQNTFGETVFTLPDGVFVAGEVLTIKIKTSATQNHSVFFGKIQIQTVE